MSFTKGITQIQNVSLEKMAAEHGTPLYVYDGQKILDQISNLQTAFGSMNTKIKYACKALTNISVLSLVQKSGIDIDCVSIQEGQIALMAGFKPEQVQYTPSGVHFSEIEKAIELGFKINIDSLQAIEQIGQKYGDKVPVSVRINPYVADGGNHKISTANKDSKFGISWELCSEIRATADLYNVKIAGLHQHTGSDIKSADSFLKATEVLFEMALTYFPDLEYLDFGGGFKVAYSEKDHITDITKLGNEISKGVSEFCQKYGRDLEIWFEPGKYLVSECGYLLVTANVVKHSPHKHFVCVDSGLNHLIRPMMYDAYHEIENLTGRERVDHQTYDIVGNICETDTFGSNRTLPVTQPGDILILYNAGAYGFSMASQYNSRFRPAEVLVINGEAHLVRSRETLEDILKNQIHITL